MPPYGIAVYIQYIYSIAPRGTPKHSVTYTSLDKKLIPTAFSLVINYDKPERQQWLNKNDFRKIMPVKSFRKRRGTS